MKLNEKYSIVYDSENVILQFSEYRINKKGENKLVIDNMYYPSLKTALNGFLVKCTWEIKTAEEVLKELNRVENLINQL